MAVVIAIDAGTTGVRAIAVDDGGPLGGLAYREFTQHFPRPGLGRARRRRDLGRACRTCSPTSPPTSADGARPSPPSASPTSARPWWSGTGAPASRCTAPSSGRTGAPPSAATSCATPGTCRWSARPPASCSTLLLGHQARVALHRGRRRPGRRRRVRHHRLLAALEPHRRPAARGPRHRPVERQPHDAARHPRPHVVARAVRPVRRARPRAARGAAVERPLRRHRRVGRRRRRRHPGLGHRRRPAGGAVRPGLLRAGHDQEHLRHRLVRADERRRPLPRTGRRPAHHRRVDDPGRRRRERPGDPLRLRGRHLRHRRGGAVAARRARHHRRRRPRSGRWPRRSTDTDGVVLVPAFTGLGSPWWDPYARGTIVGITRGTGRAHLARAVVESMAFQTRDVVDAMSAASGHTVQGAAGRRRRLGRWTCCCSSRPTSSACPVARPVVQETTALGAAYLAGLAEGVWGVVRGDRRPTGSSTCRSTPGADRTAADAAYDALASGRLSSGPGGWASRLDASDRADQLQALRVELAGVRRSCSARETGCRRSGPGRPPAAVPERGTPSRCGRAPAPGLPRAAAPTPRRRDRGSRRRPGPSPGCRRRRPAATPRSGASPWRVSSLGRVELDHHAPLGADRAHGVHAQLVERLGGVGRADQHGGGLEGIEAGVAERLGQRRDLLDVDAVDLLHLVDQQAHEVVDRTLGVRAARRPARRWPGPRPARGCRCRPRRRRPPRCGWPPRRGRRAGPGAKPGRRRCAWRPR